jgi:hypothetical protein
MEKEEFQVIMALIKELSATREVASKEKQDIFEAITVISKAVQQTLERYMQEKTKK